MVIHVKLVIKPIHAPANSNAILMRYVEEHYILAGPWLNNSHHNVVMRYLPRCRVFTSVCGVLVNLQSTNRDIVAFVGHF